MGTVLGRVLVMHKDYEQPTAEDEYYAKRFNLTHEEVRTAVAKMLEEAHRVATGESQNYGTFEDAFGESGTPDTPSTDDR